MTSILFIQTHDGQTWYAGLDCNSLEQIVSLIAEPYSTMVHVAVYSGLRVSELIGLRWADVGSDSLMVDEHSARKLGLGFANWRCLRTSYGTWLKRYGADMKDIQGQLRHSRLSTTMDIYVQDIPESLRRTVDKLPVPALVQ